MIVEHVRKTRLSRSKFLAVAGATLVGVATKAWFPGRAEAAPNGCSGAPTCGCCSSTKCCSSGCSNATTCGGKQCWTSCAYIGSTLYRFDCCDYWNSGSLCICRVNLRPCT
ncbi:hypothetical protein [Nonomuraea cavernae]|uniref:Uncharacterized protein n=1 Tax=Nonomuraea cavernae TaxID=2045107 RepID=A0A917YUL9_9ACTN|nr:hypothetical protein [Nonomuraea cavernae]MCA2185513.1 hypothetical protein [Nonomuraea cavernae]GGO66698.1 hypothetical protein GCM10012289_21340 [Nonomuraea cavernae]